MERHDKTVRVAIYTRKSVEDAEDKAFNSIDAQRQMCESFIAAKAAEGWIALQERFDDYGYSGGDLNRPAYRRLISQCEQGLIDKIIVFRIDRMTRSTKDFCEFDEKMKRLGVGFTSVSEPFVDTSSPMGELVVNLIVSFGQWERKTIQERIQRHFRTALDQGFFVGGVPPYGYKVENQNLVPDPATAKNVPHIFKLFLQLKATKKVAAQLQREGIERFPGRPWTMQSVHNCLRNVRYVGDANNHGKIVKGRQEALVTRELWDKVSSILKEVTTTPGKRVPSPETALFQGLVFCGHCKHPMSYRWSKRDTLGVRKYSYFVCQQDMRKPGPTCEIRHVSVLTVQDTVERELETIMLASSSMLVRSELSSSNGFAPSTRATSISPNVCSCVSTTDPRFSSSSIARNVATSVSGRRSPSSSSEKLTSGWARVTRSTDATVSAMGSRFGAMCSASSRKPWRRLSRSAQITASERSVMPSR